MIKVVEKYGCRRSCKQFACDNCGKKFWKPVSLIRNVKHHYCSRKCSQVASRKQDQFTCAFCKNIFKRNRYRSLKRTKSGLHFCSRECKDKAQEIESGFIKLHPSHYKDGRSRYRKKRLNIIPINVLIVVGVII